MISSWEPFLFSYTYTFLDGFLLVISLIYFIWTVEFLQIITKEKEDKFSLEAEFTRQNKSNE